MTRGELFQLGAFAARDDVRCRFDLRCGEHGAEQRFCDNDAFRADVGDDVVHVGMKRDREIGGDRPRRRGPDHDEERFVGR